MKKEQLSNFVTQMQEIEQKCDEIIDDMELNKISSEHATVSIKTMYRNYINSLRYPEEEKYDPYTKTKIETQFLNQ